jgi:hypothetical protein
VEPLWRLISKVQFRQPNLIIANPSIFCQTCIKKKSLNRLQIKPYRDCDNLF